MMIQTDKIDRYRCTHTVPLGEWLSQDKKRTQTQTELKVHQEKNRGMSLPDKFSRQDLGGNTSDFVHPVNHMGEN